MAAKAKDKTRTKTEGKNRASWRGMLHFGLVVFPVEAFNAHSRGGGPIAFHQLHATCHSRIHYQKVCPIHGEVSNDEIVSGYEYSKGKYVEIEPDELDKLRTEKERSLTIDAFISPRELDPIYFDGRMYFLAPAAAEAKEPYAVLVRALDHLQRYGVGQVVFSGRQQVVLVRPYEGALQMAMLNYAAEMQHPLVDKSQRVSASEKSVQLAEKLVESWTDKHFRFSRYVDKYEQDVRKLIEAKVHGREFVVPEEAEDEPAVYNLMDALRKSMAHAGRGGAVSKRTSNGSARPTNGHRRGMVASRKRRPARRQKAS